MPGKPPRGRAVHPEWNPQADAHKLRHAMKGLGTGLVVLLFCLICVSCGIDDDFKRQRRSDSRRVCS
jgi:hypothetical protein